MDVQEKGDISSGQSSEGSTPSTFFSLCFLLIMQNRYHRHQKVLKHKRYPHVNTNMIILMVEEEIMLLNMFFENVNQNTMLQFYFKG